MRTDWDFIAFVGMIAITFLLIVGVFAYSEHTAEMACIERGGTYTSGMCLYALTPHKPE